MRQTIDIRVTIDDSLELVTATHPETDLKQVAESPAEAVGQLFGLLEQTEVVTR